MSRHVWKALHSRLARVAADAVTHRGIPGRDRPVFLEHWRELLQLFQGRLRPSMLIHLHHLLSFSGLHLDGRHFLVKVASFVR